MSALSIRRCLLHRELRASIPLLRIPLLANDRWLRMQCTHGHRSWWGDWQQDVFFDKSRFNLRSNGDHIRVRRYAGELCLPESIIERHNGRTPRFMIWVTVSYHRRCLQLRIEGNLNGNRYVCEVLEPEVVRFLHSIPGGTFQKDNAHLHVARNVRDFCSAKHMQLLPWPVYSPDMSPIEHMWDLVGRRLARDLRLTASKIKLWVRIQTI
ncbi:transposable element Tcb2 transposase [Trichonephila clavipes]|nr:transposable element Tcb2 transposase [Trichonephila clavipes]